MKQLLLIAAAATILMTAACNNDNDPGGNGVATGDGCFASFKVDGEDYLVENMALCTFIDSVLFIAQSIGTGDFQLQIDPIGATGAYTTDPTDPSLDVFIMIELNDGTRIGTADATVNVSKLSNGKVEGTFNGNFFDMSDFTMAADYVVSGGVFEADL